MTVCHFFLWYDSNSLATTNSRRNRLTLENAKLLADKQRRFLRCPFKKSFGSNKVLKSFESFAKSGFESKSHATSMFERLPIAC